MKYSYKLFSIVKFLTAMFLAIALSCITMSPVLAIKPLDDTELLARLVWLEARGEDDEGQQAVVQVVLNRLASGRWGDSLHKVVYAPGQFSRAKSIPSVKPTEKEYRNVQIVLASTEPCLPPWVMYFVSRGKHKWEGYRKYTKIGSHWFGGFKTDRKAYETKLAKTSKMQSDAYANDSVMLLQ